MVRAPARPGVSISARCPIWIDPSSVSKTCPMAQMVDRSAILNVLTSGVMYCPGKAFRSSTIPPNGENIVTVRRDSPVRSRSAICASVMSHRRSRSRSAASSEVAPARVSANRLSPSSACARRASRYSFCVATRSGL